MKKLLAMVLALVMTLSLAVSANAAFKDADKVSDTYEEAVAVLNGMGVFKGYEDGSFQPQGDITRAEVAAIVYRVYTKDVKDAKASLYATYNKFSDMTGAGWAAGYIGYCANAELVKGYPNGTFQPSGKVTGYEVLAMILRAIGYDKNGEFSGSDWALHVAQTAQQAGVLKNIKGVDLNAAATRELVAEMLFRAVADAKMVSYTAAFGYQTVSLGGDKLVKDNATLGKQNFELDKDTDTQDNWGRPTVTWTYNVGDKKTVLAVDPDATFTVATAQCDICKALDESKEAKIVEAYTNGVADKTLLTTYKATATKSMVGAQGELLEYYAVEDGYRLVVIDTYLAKVTKVTDAKLDAQGHVKSEAKLELDVYGHADITLEGSDGENFDNVKDEYLLVYINDKDVQNSEIVKTVTASTAKYTGISYKEDEIKLDNEWVKFACKYTEDEDALNEFGKLDIFYDLYNNVIGTFVLDANETVVVVDAMHTDTEHGKSVFKADLVATDAETTEYTIDTLTRDNVKRDSNDSDVLDVDDIYEKNSRNESAYPTAYDKLFKYTVNDDETLKLVAVTDSYISADAYTDISAKDRYVHFDSIEDDGSTISKVRFNDDTIFLVHENDGTYTSVTGDKMEDIEASNVEVLMKDGYAEVVYLYGDIYRTSDINQVYVPIQKVTKIVDQKINGETVKCLQVQVIPTDGDEYTVYMPLTDEDFDTIAEAIAAGKEDNTDVKIGGFFLNAVYLKDTTIFAGFAFGEKDYTLDLVDSVKKNTATLDDEDATSFNLSKVENIYVIENGKITKGSTDDVKADTYVHAFWSEDEYYVISDLYVDHDLTDYVDDYNDDMTDLKNEYDAAKKADDKAKAEATAAAEALTAAETAANEAGTVAANEQAVRIAEQKVALAETAVAKGEEGAEDKLTAANEELATAQANLAAAKKAAEDLTKAQAAKDAADKAAAATAEAKAEVAEKVEAYENAHYLLNDYIEGDLVEVELGN